MGLSDDFLFPKRMVTLSTNVKCQCMVFKSIYVSFCVGAVSTQFIALPPKGMLGHTKRIMQDKRLRQGRSMGRHIMKENQCKLASIAN